jgi:hypothetical protein
VGLSGGAPSLSGRSCRFLLAVDAAFRQWWKYELFLWFYSFIVIIDLYYNIIYMVLIYIYDQ